MKYPVSPIAQQTGPADGDGLAVWSAIDDINQLPRMTVEGQTTLWEKVSK